MRKSELNRETAETKISVSLNIDGTGKFEISTGCAFFDHMLEQLSKHSKFDIIVNCKGDTEVDYHHTVEDVGIILGKAFSEALGDKRGIKRYGDVILPMDESLVLCAADVSGRSYLSFDVDFPTQKIGDFDTELVEEFFMGFTRNSDITLHLKKISGTNSHHIAECVFKAFARTLREATSVDASFKNEIPSTKGVL